ncbi:MAG: hypothetical protein LBD74_02640 [Spirochaetaceae bacterium]|jgi:hypothetical protein|nr:hypothetical protein [Spirochaetaceae bacterium]
MKHTLRVAVVFSIGFASLFIIAMLIQWLYIRLEPTMPEGKFLGMAVLPLTLYGGILLTLRYTVRVGVPILQAVITVAILALGWSGVLVLGLERLTLPAHSQNTVLNLGSPGLILARSDKAQIFLPDPHNLQTPLVFAGIGPGLVYEATPDEETFQKGLGYPLVSFRTEVPAFLQGILRDLASTATQFRSRLNQGFPAFMLYAGGLILVLSSLRCFFTLGAWPLANLGIGILVFRGVLALEALLNMPRTQRNLFLLSGSLIPQALLSPLILYALGILLLLYTGVSVLVKQRRMYAPEVD